MCIEWGNSISRLVLDHSRSPLLLHRESFFLSIFLQIFGIFFEYLDSKCCREFKSVIRTQKDWEIKQLHSKTRSHGHRCAPPYTVMETSFPRCFHAHTCFKTLIPIGPITFNVFWSGGTSIRRLVLGHSLATRCHWGIFFPQYFRADFWNFFEYLDCPCCREFKSVIRGQKD